jgi:putative inorganic carbon (hco3(-)) transporter
MNSLAAAEHNKRDNYGPWFFFTLLYLILDYGRPQDIFPPFGFIKPGMIIILILTFFILSKGNIKVSLNKQTIMIWLFILLLSLYIPFATNNFFAYSTTKSMLMYMPFILSTVICINSIQRLDKMIFVSICIMIYISIYALTHGGVGSGNYFQDENDVSLYINMWLPFCFFLFFVTKSKLRKFLYLSGMVLGVGTVVISFSRGGFVGLVVVALVCWLSSAKKFLSAFIIILLILVGLYFAPDKYMERIQSSQDTDKGTAAERIESWKAGFKMFVSNPLGVGGNNFQVRFPEYQSDFFQKGMWGRVAHSLWFTLIPELGIVGIIIYLLLMNYNLKDILYMRRLKKQKDYFDGPDLKYLNALSGAFLASLAGFFASGTFLSVLYYPHYWYMTAIIAASMSICRSIMLHKKREATTNNAQADIV